MGNLVCNTSVANIGDVICKIGSILNTIVPVLITLGVVYFVWGVVTYVIADGEEAKKKGKDQIIYGLIGFVVIFGMWGLVNIVTRTFGFDSQSTAVVTNLLTNDKNIIGTSSSTSCNFSSGNAKLGDLINYVTCLLVNSVIPLILALAVAMFVWGVVQYVINTDEEAKREKGKQFMIWGIIGLTVMVGVWGLVSILGSTFGIKDVIPQMPH